MLPYSKPIFTICSLFVASLLFVSCTNNKIDQKTTSEIFSKANVKPLADTNYVFLKAIGDQSQIIGIGEATHGSKEFNEIRLSFFKYLVRECNYKLFFIEANFSTVSPISNYIENGTGEPAALLENSGSWLWEGQDMLAIVEWMRAYNINKPSDQKVRLIGVDMRNLTFILAEIKQYFQSHKTPNQDQILRTVHHIFEVDKDSAAHRQGLQLLNALVKKDINTTDSYTIENGDYFIYYLQLNLEEELQLGDKSLDIQKIRLRDQFMATNMLWLCRHSKSSGKAIFAAHNGHVAKSDSPFYETCGSHLQRKLGSKYFSIYLDFAHGTTEAVDISTGRLANCTISGSKDAFSYDLGLNNRESFFMNLQTAANEVRDKLNKLLLFNTIGSVYREDSKSIAKLNLIEQFDGYVYLPSVSAKVPVKTSVRAILSGK